MKINALMTTNILLVMGSKMSEMIPENINQTQPSEVNADFESGSFPVASTEINSMDSPKTNTPIPMTQRNYDFGQMIEPTDYDGSTNPKKWLAHYELVSEANLWNDESKICHLTETLKSAAGLWYSNLNREFGETGRKIDWLVFQDELINRFGIKYDSSMSSINNKKITMKNHQSFDVYWEEKFGKIKMEFPEKDDKTIINEMFKGFPNKLQNKVMKCIAYRYIETPKELRVLVKNLIDIKKYNDFYKSKNQKREQLIHSSTNVEATGTKSKKNEEYNNNVNKDNQNSKIEKDLEEMKQMIFTLMKISSPNKDNERENSETTSKAEWLEKIECYNCHKMGHFSKDCPEKKNSKTKMVCPIKNKKDGAKRN